MKRTAFLSFALLASSLTLSIAQHYIIADDIYYQKGDEIELGEVTEDVPETVDSTYNVLIVDPEVNTYEEGIIIYQNDNGANDTIYFFGDPEYYLNQQ